MGALAPAWQPGILLNGLLRAGSSIVLPNLSALDVFLAVARHQSFRRAAAERGVSPSALSHAIRGLEEALGVRLFHRTNRSIRITPAGEHLLSRIGPALGDLTEAITQLGLFRDRPAGLLRLNVPRNAAELVVRPIMAQFLATYPDVVLNIVSDDALVDIVAEGFDAGIRAGPDLGQDMISVPVGPPLRFAVVGSPRYFETRERPRMPQDLMAHACIRRRFPSGASYRWMFARADQEIEVEVSGQLVADDRTLIIGAALEGIGLAHIHDVLVADHVARGELVSVLQDWCPALPRFFLYYPGRRQLPAPLRAFIDMALTGSSQPLEKIT